MKKYRKMNWWMLLTLFAVTTVWIGCSQNNPLGPDYKNLPPSPMSAASSKSSADGNSEEPAQTDLQMTSVTYEGDRTYKLLGFLGGTLNIPLVDYYCYFYVPPAALETSLILSVQATQGYNRRGEKITNYDFWPDGLIFEKTTYLEYRTPAADGAPVQLWWFNPDKDSWELVGAGKVRNHMCTFSIQHFSNYRTWEGSVSASGQ